MLLHLSQCSIYSLNHYFSFTTCLILLFLPHQSDKCPGSPKVTLFPSLPDMSPKKVSAAHNVYVSPLRSSKVYLSFLSLMVCRAMNMVPSHPLLYFCPVFIITWKKLFCLWLYSSLYYLN